MIAADCPYVSEHVQTPDHVQIHYDLYKKGHNRLVIVAPGFFNSKQSILMKELAQNLCSDYDIIVMDFRGHGKSEGLFYWTAKEYQDLLSILQKFRASYRQVAVIGFSLGAATSIITASKTDVIDSLILVSPPKEFGSIEYHLWGLDFENDIVFNLFHGKGKGVRPGPFWHEKIKPIDVIDKIKIPMLIIHGTNDWVIKEHHSQTLFKKATTEKKKLVIIPNAPHAEYLIRKNKDETLGHIRGWLAETLTSEKTNEK